MHYHSTSTVGRPAEVEIFNVPFATEELARTVINKWVKDAEDLGLTVTHGPNAFDVSAGTQVAVLEVRPCKGLCDVWRVIPPCFFTEGPCFDPDCSCAQHGGNERRN